MSRKILFMALVIMTVVLAGCGGAATPTAAPTAAPAATAVPTKAPAAATATTAAPAATAVPTKAPAPTNTPAKPAAAGLLRLATTTSTADTGLLDAILPIFEKANSCKVDVVAVGTGQAIAIGAAGDADVILVHARASEDKFVADGHAKARYDVMYNDFILVGPKADPAKAAKPTAKDAFKAIMDAKAVFVSRGDKSGTNTKELAVWTSLGITPTKEMSWYNNIGQGMGDTLVFSNEKQGYTLADRGTWLAMKDKLARLIVIVGGNSLAENKDSVLLNPYGVLAIDPVKHPGVNSELAAKFVTWITSVETQKTIGVFGVAKYGEALFYPSSAEYKASTAPQVGALDITRAGKNLLIKTDMIKQLAVQKIQAEHPKNGMQSYTGVRISTLLDEYKKLYGDASGTALVLTARDGFSTEVALADVLKTADCLLALTSEGKLDAVMPGMASKAWVKDVIKLELK